MDIVVHIQPGARIRVGAIHLTNNTEYPDAEIAARFKLKAGKELTNGKIQSGTNRIRKFLVSKGRLSGRAAVRREAYDSAKNTVDLTLDVSEGARVKIEAIGAKLSSGDLKKLVPIFQEGAVDPDLLEEGKKNIRERLERAGYFDSSVEYTSATREVQTKSWHGQELVITYKIERGDRHKLTGLEITGNHYFDKELLFSRLQIYKAAFGSRGRFSRRLIEADRQSMENLYRANGFPAATVAAQILDDYEKKTGRCFHPFCGVGRRANPCGRAADRGKSGIWQARITRSHRVTAGPALFGFQRGHGSGEYPGAIFQRGLSRGYLRIGGPTGRGTGNARKRQLDGGKAPGSNQRDSRRTENRPSCCQNGSPHLSRTRRATNSRPQGFDYRFETHQTECD
jgi:hypothetical protein